MHCRHMTQRCSFDGAQPRKISLVKEESGASGFVSAVLPTVPVSSPALSLGCRHMGVNEGNRQVSILDGIVGVDQQYQKCRKIISAEYAQQRLQFTDFARSY